MARIRPPCFAWFEGDLSDLCHIVLLPGTQLSRSQVRASASEYLTPSGLPDYYEILQVMVAWVMLRLMSSIAAQCMANLANRSA